MRTVLLTGLACLILLVAGAAVFIYSGNYDIAAIDPDNPLIARIFRIASDRSVAVRLDAIQPPATLDQPQIIAAGAKLYGQKCVVCHGGPGVAPSDISKGMNPTPPSLYLAAREPDPKEDFWFVSNGVKMSGMPSWSKSLSNEQIWSLVAFINTLPGMSASDFTAKTDVAAGAAVPDASSAAETPSN